jgi:phospho-N-acetylmuramoyl-pentapeptide-transferase
MFYYLASYFKNYASFFNVVHYVSFRVMASLLTALFLSFLIGPWFIAQSHKWFRSKVREYTPESHQAKNYTPTMGGLFILLTSFITIFLWGNLERPEIWIFLLCLAGFGLIGLWDDLKKIWYRKGISERNKFCGQLIVSFIVVCLWIWLVNPPTIVCVPFFKTINPDLGLFLIPWAIFILIGASNAVNLTDGLDGLAIGSLLLNFATFSVIAYVAGHYAFAHYLHIPFTQTAEIAVIGSTLVGASLGFLWYNTYPAQIFMGDVGSLALGAGLALMALMTRQELLLVLSGGLFVVETLSVMAQVLSFKLRGKRVFKMAPIHHHFELMGWPEAKITIRFGIISVILCLVALMTLKIR